MTIGPRNRPSLWLLCLALAGASLTALLAEPQSRATPTVQAAAGPASSSSSSSSSNNNNNTNNGNNNGNGNNSHHNHRTAVVAVGAAAAAASSSAPPSQPATVAIKVNFTDCGPKNVKEVRITPCPGDGNICNINLGTNVTVEADFIAKHEARSLNEIIKGVVRGRELQFPEQRADPCKSTISPKCPIEIGKFYQYKATFEIKPFYPAIPVKVRYALANPAGDVIACVQIGAKIIDPSPITRSSRAKKPKKTAAAAAA